MVLYNACLIKCTGNFLICFLIILPINKLSAQFTTDPLVKYHIKGPIVTERGKRFQIEVSFNVQPDWYIYAPTGVNAADGMIETKVVFKLPEGIHKVGKMDLPKPIYKNGHEVYTGKNIMMCQIFETSASLRPGTYEIKGKVTYQTCSAAVCLPPVADEVVAMVIVR